MTTPNILDQINHDPMTDDPKTAKLIDLATDEAQLAVLQEHKKNRHWFYKIFPFLEPESNYMGKCHLIWHHKKKILKEKYNIDWKTPQERFPGAKFD